MPNNERVRSSNEGVLPLVPDIHEQQTLEEEHDLQGSEDIVENERTGSKEGIENCPESREEGDYSGRIQPINPGRRGAGGRRAGDESALQLSVAGRQW